MAYCFCLSDFLLFPFTNSTFFSPHLTLFYLLFISIFQYPLPLSFCLPLSLHPCLTGRHNSRCLVVVLKTCLLHDGRLLACHPSSFAVVLSSDSGPLLSSGLSVWLLYRDTLGQADPSSIQCQWDRGSGLCPRTIPSPSCHYLILLFTVLKYSVSSLSRLRSF